MSEENDVTASGGFWQIFKDDQGNISSARIMSIWGYCLLTILVAVELVCGKTVGQEDLYLWLIGASAGGKAAGKYFEKPK